MNIRYIKYGIYTAGIALLLMAVSSCNRTEIEEVEAQGDGIKFAFSENRLPGSKSGAAEAYGDIRTITLKSDTDEMVLYRKESPSALALENITETKGTPVTTDNIGSLYTDELYTRAYTAVDHNTFLSPLKLAYEENKEGKSIWRVTKSFVWPKDEGKLSFWAWAPNSVINPTDANIKDSEGKMTFTYTMPAPGTDTKKADAEAQQDIILGHTVTAKPDDYIAMTMDHALTALRFEMDNTTSFKVKSIKLGEVYSTGDCTYTPNASKIHAYEQIEWSDLGSAQTYTQDFNQTIVEGTEDEPQEIGPQEATFMVIPQCAIGGNSISFDLTIEVDGVDKHYATTLKNEDWKAGVTYTYGIDFDGSDYEFKLTNAEQSSLIYTNTTEPSATTVVPVTSNRLSAGETYDAEWDIASYTIGGVTTEVTDNQFTDGGLTVIKDGKNVNITALARKTESIGSNDYWVNTEGRTDHLEWSPASWSDKGIVDLSKYNFQNESTNNPMTTANCYIIRHSGRYMLPLIYGNAVQNGTVHTETYYPNVTGGKLRLINFLNHKGKSLEVENDAFIENNDGCGGSDLKCAVIWQDCAQVVTNLCFSTDEVAPETIYNINNVRYLQFEVSQNSICQNNALICIYKDLNSNNKYDEGEAVWSWHIWTTNDPALIGNPIIVTNQTPQKYGFFPINCLGWIEPINYSERTTLKLLLKQKISNNIIEIEVNQPIVRGSSFGTLYQFGRKDPVPGKELDKLVSGSIFNKNGAGRVTLQVAIGNPATFYHTPNTSGYHDWCSTAYYNLWTGKLSAFNAYEDDSNLNIKTIYDPSPAGYKVPASKAFSIFTTENAEGGFNSGWNFYCDNTKANTIFFPAIPMRNGDSQHDGSLTNPGEFGVFWASMPFNESNSYCLSFSNSSSAVRSSDRCTGYGVRPVIE